MNKNMDEIYIAKVCNASWASWACCVDLVIQVTYPNLCGDNGVRKSDFPIRENQNLIKSSKFQTSDIATLLPTRVNPLLVSDWRTRKNVTTLLANQTLVLRLSEHNRLN